MMGDAHLGTWRCSFARAALAAALALVVVGHGGVCRADDEPKPDPAGIATGDRTSVYDAGGTAFVVAEPTDKTAADYAQKKKDFDEYQAAAEKEPLAMKLADAVGHVRVATNFAWTLNTGYLVLFMQAGFALLTCGLVRKKNAGPPDDAQLRGLRLRLPRLLRCAASRSSSAPSPSTPRRSTWAARRP